MKINWFAVLGFVFLMLGLYIQTELKSDISVILYGIVMFILIMIAIKADVPSEVSE